MNGKTNWVLGADRDCDVVVDFPSVSRRHCRLSRKPDGSFTLEDLGSTNGTFVNGQQIRAETPVRRTDAITLGLTVAMPWPEMPAIVEPGVNSRVVRVGREPDNDLVLDRPEVSGYHGRIVIAKGAQTGFVEDLGSTNGTSVNALTPRVSRAAITPADVVYFGPVAVNAATFFSAEPVVIREGVPELIFEGKSMILGRDLSCDRVLENPVVSSRHARIVRCGRFFWLEDLGSSNGTFVHGRRIEKRTAVKPGDLIGLGGYEVRLVDGSPELEGTPGAPRFRLIAVTSALVLQTFCVPLLIALIGGGSNATEWLGLTLGVFWIGLSWGLYERFFWARLERSAREDRSEAAHWVLSLFRIGAIDLLQCVMVGSMVVIRQKLNDGLESMAVLWLTALIGSALGDLLGRLTGDWAASLAISVGTIVAMGFLTSPAWTLPGLGPAGRLVAEMVPSRWAFEALLEISAGEAVMDARNDPVERFYPSEMDRMGRLACASALVAMLVGLVSLDGIMAHSERDRWRRGVPVWR